MVKRTDDHRENIEECKNVFPTWQWVVGIVAGAVIVACGFAYEYGSHETKQDGLLVDLDRRMIAVEGVKSDLDTIKTMLRKK